MRITVKTLGDLRLATVGLPASTPLQLADGAEVVIDTDDEPVLVFTDSPEGDNDIDLD